MHWKIIVGVLAVVIFVSIAISFFVYIIQKKRKRERGNREIQMHSLPFVENENSIICNGNFGGKDVESAISKSINDNTSITTIPDTRNSNQKIELETSGMKRKISSNNFLSKENLYLSDIEIERKLGTGKFGEVWLGNWSGTTPVAMKKLKSGVQNESEFEKEIALIMKLNHPNIVRAIGIFRSDLEDLFLVMEYLSLGSLQDFLRENTSQSTLQLKDLLFMAVHVAAGCHYLEQKNIIHRDLGTRNLLVANVDGKFVVKITDFGLSREVSNKIYESSDGTFASKWASPEVIQHRKFSHKSDVWSFSVCLWEIFEFGKVPYQTMSNREALEAVLEGYRLEKPKSCPEEVYTLMLRCWNDDPEQRPSFKEIFKSLTEILVLLGYKSSITTSQTNGSFLVVNPTDLYNNMDTNEYNNEKEAEVEPDIIYS